MELKTFTETMIVQNSEADFRRQMKPGALLRCTEQIATDHARAFGMDDAFFAAHRTALLVGKQALRFFRVPQRAERLTLTTFSEKSKRGSIKRITHVTDAAGEPVALVDSRWIAVDTSTQRILRQPDWTVENYWNEDVEESLPQQVHRAAELTSAGVFRADYSRCDLNGHINNASYLDIACDALPPEVLRQGPVMFATLKYNRQVPLWESMEVFYAPSGEGWYVLGRREEQNAFECYLEF